MDRWINASHLNIGDSGLFLPAYYNHNDKAPLIKLKVTLSLIMMFFDQLLVDTFCFFAVHKYISYGVSINR